MIIKPARNKLSNAPKASNAAASTQRHLPSEIVDHETTVWSRRSAVPLPLGPLTGRGLLRFCSVVVEAQDRDRARRQGAGLPALRGRRFAERPLPRVVRIAATSKPASGRKRAWRGWGRALGRYSTGTAGGWPPQREREAQGTAPETQALAWRKTRQCARCRVDSHARSGGRRQPCSRRYWGERQRRIGCGLLPGGTHCRRP